MQAVDHSRELAWIRSRMAQPLAEAGDAAVIGTNLQGVVAYWNAAAEALYGWPQNEAVGRDILDLTPTKYTRGQSGRIMRALQAGEMWRGEILVRRRDGAALLAFVLDIPLGDFGNGQGAIVGISAPAAERAKIDGRARLIQEAVWRRFEQDRPAGD